MRKIRFNVILGALLVPALALPAVAQQAPAATPAAPAAAPAGRGAGNGRGGGRGGYQPPTGPAPRMADGHVDFSGNWAPNAIQQNINLASVGGEPPMLPWAEKVYTDHKSNISKEDPEARCLPPG